MFKVSSFSFQNLLNHPYNEQSSYLQNLSNLNQNSRQDLNWKPLRARKSFLPLISTATFPHCNGTLLTVVTRSRKTAPETYNSSKGKCREAIQSHQQHLLQSIRILPSCITGCYTFFLRLLGLSHQIMLKKQKDQKCGPVGGTTVLLGVDSEVSKVHVRPSLSSFFLPACRQIRM